MAYTVDSVMEIGVTVLIFSRMECEVELFALLFEYTCFKCVFFASMHSDVILVFVTAHQVILSNSYKQLLNFLFTLCVAKRPKVSFSVIILVYPIQKHTKL